MLTEPHYRKQGLFLKNFKGSHFVSILRIISGCLNVDKIQILSIQAKQPRVTSLHPTNPALVSTVDQPHQPGQV